MVFNATFNNVSVISWQSVLLGKPHTKLYHIMLYNSPYSRFELTTSVVIGTDCKGSFKSNYHTVTTTMVPSKSFRNRKKHELLASLSFLFPDDYTIFLWLAIGRWFFTGTPVSSTNETDRHDIAEILLKVTLNIITLPYPLMARCTRYNIMW